MCIEKVQKMVEKIKLTFRKAQEGKKAYGPLHNESFGDVIACGGGPFGGLYNSMTDQQVRQKNNYPKFCTVALS